MRCCIKSLDDYEDDEAAGTVLHCKYCTSGMVVAPDGVWEWSEAGRLRDETRIRQNSDSA